MSRIKILSTELPGKAGLFLLISMLAITPALYAQWSGTPDIYYNGGNVGIGTTGPATKLEVVGDINASGTGGSITSNRYLFVKGNSTNGYGNSGLIRLYGTSNNEVGQFGAFSSSEIQTYLISGVNYNIYDAALSSSAFYIKTGGNVGIGTTSPVSKLHLGAAPTATANYGTFSLGSAPFDGSTSGYFTGSSNGTHLAINAASGSTSSFTNFQTAGVMKFSVGPTGSTSIALSNGAYTAQGSNAIPWALSTIGGSASASVPGNVSIGGGSGGVQIGRGGSAYGSIGCGVQYTTGNSTFNYGSSDYATLLDFDAGQFLFKTAPSGTAGNAITFTTRMAIGNTGNVGIGTTAPASKLHLAVAPTATANYGTFSLGSAPFDGSTSGYFTGSSNGTQLAINAASGATADFVNFQLAGAARFKITSTGTVGVGDNSPQSKLSVDGPIRSTSNSPLPTSGKGLELHYQPSPELSVIASKDRSTSDNLPMSLRASIFDFTGGNVGIGTTTPAEKLVVQTSTSNYGMVHTDGTRSVGMYVDGSNGYFGTKSNHPLAFFTNSGSAQVLIKTDGNVGIGTTNPTYKLDVCGNIRAKKVKVETGWCDYVFEDTYKLMPIEELQSYVNKHHHLPEIPAEKEIVKEGLDLGDMQTMQMKKIEEMTLYIIALKKEMNEMKSEMKDLKQKLEK